MELREIKFYLKRLYKDYVKNHLWRLLLALILSLVVAGTTASIAWLLDPAVKKIFVENDRTFAFIIPVLIILVFSAKGLSLYFARYVIIVLGFRVLEKIQSQMSEHILLSDTQSIESKHSGRYVASFLYDVGLIKFNSTGFLNIMKDSLTLITLLLLCFIKLEACFIFNDNDAVGCIFCKIIGKGWEKQQRRVLYLWKFHYFAL